MAQFLLQFCNIFKEKIYEELIYEELIIYEIYNILYICICVYLISFLINLIFTK